jgi:hypothetical protein
MGAIVPHGQLRNTGPALQAILNLCSAELLYLLTGISTLIPTLWMLGWGVWGAPTYWTQYVSLFGSLVLIASAFVPAKLLRGRIALAGVAAVWPSYLWTIFEVGRIRLSDQELRLSVLHWSPSSEPLTIKEYPGSEVELSPAEARQIKESGITGSLTFLGGGTFGSGPKSRVILILQKPLTSAVKLLQPDAASVIYVQEQAGWRTIPSGVPTLTRQIVIEPMAGDAHQNHIGVELATGGVQGFGLPWPTPVKSR